MKEYLKKEKVCKDFHGILSSIFSYLEKEFGQAEAEEILKSIYKEIYADLIYKINDKGLEELVKHLKDVFDIEDGKYEIDTVNNEVIVKVDHCPAIRPAKEHMEKRNKRINKNFCKYSTELFGRVIEEETKYKFSLEYELEKEKCIQRYWEK